jgi:hypothetical protein
MKKITQKRLVKYFHDNIERYSDLVLYNMKQTGYTQPEEAWMVDHFLYSHEQKHTKSTFNEIKLYRDFILNYEEYIRQAICNINKVLVDNDDYNKLHPFEKFLSVYNSYLEVEKIQPGLGKEVIVKFYETKNNLV